MRALYQPARLLAAAGAVAAAAAATTGAAAAPLPAGTVITGSVAGAAPRLLGLDAGFADVPGSNVTALDPADLEYLTSDYAVGVDFRTDGLVLFYDNTGSGLLAGSYTFTFDFAALADPVANFAVADLSSLSGGSVSARALSSRAVQITLRDVAYAAPFAAFSARVTTVPEPGTLALVLAGAGLALLRPAGRHRA